MRKSDFHYTLPPELIAQTAIEPRSASRLLVLDRRTGATADRQFADLPPLLDPGDLLVFNDTRVLRARLHGRKPGGGRMEVLLERIVAPTRALAQLRGAKGGKIRRIDFDGAVADIVGREGEFYVLEFSEPVDGLLERAGDIPLPPYIDRAPEAYDSERYQTLFARTPGAVAAPTAGLHFDESILAALHAHNIEQAFVTLHVGAGTFKPMRVEDPTQHRMHQERVSVDETVCARIEATRSRGGRVVAVGTTVVRALETAARSGELRPFSGETDIFIYPGYRFRAIDALITNFHLPESTLLMLVCAFAGTDAVLRAYAHAVQARYRFFSYGDAMLVV